MNDLARARRDCSMALELADDAHDESLAQKSLGYFATLYVVADTVRIPEDLLRRIEQSVLCDTTVSECVRGPERSCSATVRPKLSVPSKWRHGESCVPKTVPCCFTRLTGRTCRREIIGKRHGRSTASSA